MNEQLISYETAELAKDKGFDEKHSDFYIDKRKNGDFTDLPCVPQSFLQKWLREKHGMHAAILPCLIPSDEVKYYIFRGKLTWDWNELFNTYEDALEHRLKEILKSL